MNTTKNNNGQGSEIKVDGKSIDADVISSGRDSYHIIRNNKSYRAEILDMDLKKKTFSVLVNDNFYQIKIKDKNDLLLKELGMDRSSTQKVGDIKAPMPGLVVEVKVKSGDEVEKDQSLIVLEAMKMENVIKSTGEGVVKKIYVKKGDAVEKGQPLMTL